MFAVPFAVSHYLTRISIKTVLTYFMTSSKNQFILLLFLGGTLYSKLKLVYGMVYLGLGIFPPAY